MATLLELQDQLKDWSYEYLGPTTVHLHFEFFLLLSLTFFTIASLQGLYKDSFGLVGDYIYIGLAFLYLSRHLVFRILCTWDPSTHANPTLRGWLSHLSTAYLTGGQIHDRPMPAHTARLVGMDDTMCNTILPSGAIYASQWFLSLWQPSNSNSNYSNEDSDDRRRQRRYRKSSSGSINNWISTSLMSLFRTNDRRELAVWQQGRMYLETMKNKVWSLWISNGPSLQFLAPPLLGLLCLMSLNILPYSLIFGKDDNEDDVEWTLLAMDSRSRNAVNKASSTETNMPRGKYQPFVVPTWYEMVGSLLGIGQLLTLVALCRILLPLPDLVRRSSSMTTSSAVGGTPSRSSSGHGSKTHSSNNNQNHLQLYAPSSSSHEIPWTERVRPISSMPRWRLHVWVLTIRFVENFLACVTLPRSYFGCRLLGHCTAGDRDNNRIWFPAGISQTYREDGFREPMKLDIPSALWVTVGVTSVTGTLLMAHALVVQKAHWAIWGYVASEWKRVEGSNAKTNSNNNPPNIWDARRKYKKGDLVSFPVGRRGHQTAIFQATENHPRGKPSVDEFAELRQSLQSELGHPSTSHLLSQLAQFQVLAALSVIVICLLVWTMGVITTGRSSFPYGAWATLMAFLTALHALATIGSTNFNELEQINREIKQAVVTK